MVTARYRLICSLTLLTLVSACGESRQPSDRAVQVAVATNFKPVAEQLADAFMRTDSSHNVALSSGSSGKLFTQIVHGAPFDLFLSADQARPQLLIEQGLAVKDSQRTYALGRLALVGSQVSGEQTLAEGDFRNLAIANPRLAPYGVAAEQTLSTLGLNPQQINLVYGENVGQAFAMVATGNAEFGLVAQSLVNTMHESPRQLKSWPVPAHYHTPIKQDLVVLNRAANNPTAKAFMAFILDPKNQSYLTAAGLDSPTND